MSSTKKGFMRAGSIISIVLAVIFVLGGLITFGSDSFINKELVLGIYRADTINYREIEDENGISFEYIGSDITMKGTIITEDDINLVVTFAKNILKFVSWSLIILAVLNMVFAIMVLNVASKGSNNIGSIITLLIISVVSMNMITMAFMIVALCLKNKAPEVENQPSEIQA